MSNWRVILATMMIFGAGVITGGLLVDYTNDTRFKPVRKPAVKAHGTNTNQLVRAGDGGKPLQPPEMLSRQFLQRLNADLHLTPAQHDAIQKIITEGQNLMRKVMLDSRLEIREVLTPEQQQQFDDMMKRQFRKNPFNTNSVPQTLSVTNAPVTNAPAN